MSGPKITAKQLIDAIADVDKPLHPRYIYRLSDISDEDLAELKAYWPAVPAWRRQAILEDIEDLESDYVLSFEAIARYTLTDPEPRVRELAVRVLSEYELTDMAPVFMRMMLTDADVEVRAASASALGTYIYLGEIEHLQPSVLHEIEDCLLNTTTGSDHSLVRRRALESLGYSSREELPQLIEKAYDSGNKDWLISALFAMGRSANDRWEAMVLEHLQSQVEEVRFEAARAAGELELRAARPILFEMLDEDNADIRMTAAWSLSQIGGEGVQEALESLLEETEETEEAEFLEDALENLEFTEDTSLLDLMEVDEEPDFDDEQDEYAYDDEEETDKD